MTHLIRLAMIAFAVLSLLGIGWAIVTLCIVVIAAETLMLMSESAK